MTENALQVGAIVTPIGGTFFDRHQGFVMSVVSDLEPEDGPVAVFFDREVPSHLFSGMLGGRRWDGEPPTPEDYKGCPRVVCFLQEELRVESGFSLKTRCNRLFRGMWHSLNYPKFDLVPGTYDCHFEECTSGLPATEETLVNIWGTVVVVHACSGCHEKFNGLRGEVIDLKNPLPAPSGCAEEAVV